MIYALIITVLIAVTFLMWCVVRTWNKETPKKEQ